MSNSRRSLAGAERSVRNADRSKGDPNAIEARKTESLGPVRIVAVDYLPSALRPWNRLTIVEIPAAGAKPSRAAKGREEGAKAMTPQKDEDDSINHDAAIAAANVILEDFFPHCPNGMASAIHERLSEIVEAAITSATSARWQMWNEPSKN